MSVLLRALAGIEQHRHIGGPGRAFHGHGRPRMDLGGQNRPVRVVWRQRLMVHDGPP
ncbi:MAG: hypothetical protein LW862_09555 [Rubrivivax sp.]|nr:hypothetical protein [Rubrivivax sp.]